MKPLLFVEKAAPKAGSTNVWLIWNAAVRALRLLSKVRAIKTYLVASAADGSNQPINNCPFAVPTLIVAIAPPAGADTIAVSVPAGVPSAANLRARMTLGVVSVDRTRRPRAAADRSDRQ